VYAAVSEDVVASYVDAFEKYQVKFDKHYDTKEEYDRRLRAYATSMEEVKELNEKYAHEGVVYGETSRSDILEEEKMVDIAPLAAPAGMKNTRATSNYPQPKLAKDHTEANMPTEFNWFNVSGVKGPAKDQGSCGSCWAFSAIGALEMQAVLEGYDYMNLSTQEAVDCAKGASLTSKGCCGGYPGDTYDGVKVFTLESLYPYELAKHRSSNTNCSPISCRLNDKSIEVTIRGYDRLQGMSGAELKKLIWMYGPISVWLYVPSAFYSYQSGIFDCTDKGTGGGHYVVAVGFGPGYIAVRNSWGPTWGLQGDFLMSDRDANSSCGMVGRTGSIQMARVSVVPRMIRSENSAAKALPFLTFALIFILSCLQWF